MFARPTNAARVLSSVGLLAMLAACAAPPMGPTVQVMPGPGKTFDAFRMDQANCKAFADDQVRGQAEVHNQRAVGGAVLSTVIGAGLGAAVGGAYGNVGAGAAIGAASGATMGAAYGADATANANMSIQQQYDNAFSQCMYAKGEQVPGYAPLTPPPPPSGPVAQADPLVRATQSELIRIGYLNGSADGFMGPRTRGAISSFEQANGLPVDGAPSPNLLGRLQATPAGGGAPTASAPGNWVAPGNAGNAAPSGWVAPAR